MKLNIEKTNHQVGTLAAEELGQSKITGGKGLGYLGGVNWQEVKE